MRVEFYLGLIDLILTNLKRLIHFRLVGLVIFEIKRFLTFLVLLLYIYTNCVTTHHVTKTNTIQ